jgi:hypothetical protein
VSNADEPDGQDAADHGEGTGKHSGQRHGRDEPVVGGGVLHAHRAASGGAVGTVLDPVDAGGEAEDRTEHDPCHGRSSGDESGPLQSWYLDGKFEALARRHLQVDSCEFDVDLRNDAVEVAGTAEGDAEEFAQASDRLVHL